jgi:hypothetical protein
MKTLDDKQIDALAENIAQGIFTLKLQAGDIPYRKAVDGEGQGLTDFGEKQFDLIKEGIIEKIQNA